MITCQYCNKEQEVFSSRGNRRYCSRRCQNAAISEKNKGKLRTSKWKACSYCGKPVKQFKSRKNERKFCNTDCYHKWDSWYKSQPAQQKKFADQYQRMGDCAVSKIEDTVSNWLHRNNTPHERQVKMSRYSFDFRVNGAFLEVQGCYWHGCPHCYLMLTPKQQKRASRDKAKATYCRKRGIKLYYIWEHDIRQGDFSALTPLLTTSDA